MTINTHPAALQGYRAGWKASQRGSFNGQLDVAEDAYAARGGDAQAYADGWLDYVASDDGGPSTLAGAIRMRYTDGYTGDPREYGHTPVIIPADGRTPVSSPVEVVDYTNAMSWEYELLGYPSCNRALMYPVTLTEQARALATPELFEEWYRADDVGDVDFYNAIAVEVDYRERFTTLTRKPRPNVSARRVIRDRGRVRDLSTDTLIELVARYRALANMPTGVLSVWEPLQAELDARARARTTYRLWKAQHRADMTAEHREHEYARRARVQSTAWLEDIVALAINGPRTRAAERELSYRRKVAKWSRAEKLAALTTRTYSF